MDRRNLSMAAPAIAGVLLPLAVGIYFEQVLWHEPESHKQKLRLFMGTSVSDGDPSFGKMNGFASLEAHGLLFGRENDRAGIGGFYNKLSSDFKGRTHDIGANVGDTWGSELYYNFEVTPWFHLTPNL